MKRRKLLLQTMHGAGIAAIGLVFSPLVSSLALLQAGQSERLVEQLKAGLKVRKPAEKLFVEQVVQLVDKKVLPLSMVLGVFQYARKKEDRYPFFYFREALKIRAAKELGVKL
ncbi:MAG: hypothetical protein HN617_09045 [Planctomycetaceae bacterium]|jgi:hypothetical protein|nr:hypothetical protein [Planctomycetaceae bacterium]MBT4011314.1 hypothetical protein [Planctomycetaceae bacterium]MBT4725779.1 hypothetical protein [Planctomycetaceae bacterium]MBT4843942.1 hypothetical protein [Planctomycetaceae bacterium]MBT5124315.1 hypothetical protein [Planctomycetaceae bacterium]